MRIAALLVDLDGVLADTEGPVLESLAARLTEHGFAGDAVAAAAHYRGLNLDYCADDLTELLGRPLPSTFVADVRRRVAHTAIRPEPGAADLLGAGVPFRIVTNSTRAQASRTLARAGLDRFVPARSIIAVDDVGAPKPEPDLHLTALDSLGIGPELALAIEDSLTGLAAAQAAGTHAVGYSIEASHRDLLRRSGFPAIARLSCIVESVVADSNSWRGPSWLPLPSASF